MVDRAHPVDRLQREQQRLLSVGVESARAAVARHAEARLREGVHVLRPFLLVAIGRLEAVGPGDAEQRLDHEPRGPGTGALPHGERAGVLGPGRRVAAHVLEPVRIAIHRADDARVGASPGALGDPHRVLELAIRFAVALETHQASDEGIEDGQLSGVQQSVEISAQVERALQRDARILELPGDVVGRAEPVQRAQQQPVAVTARIRGDLHAAHVAVLGMLVVAQTVLRGAEIAERIDQRAIARAELLLGELDQLRGERQRVGIMVRVEGRAEIPIDGQAVGVGDGERPRRRQQRRNDHQGQPLQSSHGRSHRRRTTRREKW